MAISATVAHLRAKNARLRALLPPDHPEIIKVRQELKAARIEDYLRLALKESPALTPEARYRLSQLLRRGRA